MGVHLLGLLFMYLIEAFGDHAVELPYPTREL
jgi:hypothetical protein